MPYLIDGNNLLGSWGGPAIPGDGRAEVVRVVASFCRAKGARAVLVFDGAPFRPELGGQQLGHLTLRFPAPGRDADSVIREVVDSAKRPGELVVVTSDKPLSSYARTRGAQVLRAHAWNALARDAKPQPRKGAPGDSAATSRSARPTSKAG